MKACSIKAKKENKHFSTFELNILAINIFGAQKDIIKILYTVFEALGTNNINIIRQNGSYIFE